MTLMMSMPLNDDILDIRSSRSVEAACLSNRHKMFLLYFDVITQPRGDKSEERWAYELL